MEKKYFDNASTTKVLDDVLADYIKANNDFYNPSALNTESIRIKNEIEDCRAKILQYLHAKPKSKFIFTSSASESNNSVLNSCIRRKDKHYIVTAGEHSSIFNACKAYIANGYNIEFAPLLKNGQVDEEKLYSMINEKTEFVSVIHVSNETGAVNDIKSICKKIKTINPKIKFHSDGVQALHKFDVNLEDLGVDFYTISSHKINGVKGIAGLYIAYNINFTPHIYGGGQEFGLRGGTENYPSIKAFTTAILKPNYDNAYLKNLKELLLNNINVEHELISSENAVPNIVSIAFAGVRGETLLHILDDKGFIVGTGSACNSKDTTNRVLDAMGIDKKLALGNLRISFDDKAKKEDVILLAKAINESVKEYLGHTKKHKG